MPCYERARVTTPGRLHFSVFDFSTMARGGPGGGGLGVSTGTATSQVAFAVGGGDDGARLSATTRHLMHLFAACVDYDVNDLSVSVETRVPHTHHGFGSNVTFNTAVVSGLNALFGSPFSVEEVWHMLTQNYVENAVDGEHLHFGLDTGVGEACVLYGGMAYVDEGTGRDDGRYLGSVETADLWVVTAVGIIETMAGEAVRAHDGAVVKGFYDKSETNIVFGLCQEYQEAWGPALRELISTRLRPALLRDDLNGLLAAAWELNEIGNMKVLERIYDPEVLRNLNATARQAGALCAGLSSIGPTFYAFAKSEAGARELQKILENRVGHHFQKYAVGRAGRKLSIELDGA